MSVDTTTSVQASGREADPTASRAPRGDAALQRIAELEQERDAYLDHLRRERADFENYRRRTTKERMNALDRGAQQLAADLLHVVDMFNTALSAADQRPDDPLAKGVQMVHDELLRVLRDAGLEEVPGVGSDFDPAYHEALETVPADTALDTPRVVEVLRPGYGFKGRVLRPAAVTVAKWEEPERD